MQHARRIALALAVASAAALAAPAAASAAGCYVVSRFYPGESWFNARLAQVDYSFNRCPRRSPRSWKARLRHYHVNSTGKNLSFSFRGRPKIRRTWVGKRNAQFKADIPWEGCMPPGGWPCRVAGAVIRFTVGPRSRPRVHVDSIRIVPADAGSDFEVFRTP